MHVPTSRGKRKIYTSLLDAAWALASPAIALYVGGALAVANQDWTMVGTYCALSAAFAIVAILAFRLQDSVSQHFSAHEALDIAEAVLFPQVLTYAVLLTLTRLDGIARSLLLYHGALLAAGLILVLVVRLAADKEVVRATLYQFRSERVIVIG